MKNIIYSLFFLIMLSMTGCSEELPKASWSLYEIQELKATAQDASVLLTWSIPAEAQPTGYYISWSSSSGTVSGGSMTIEDMNVTSVQIPELTNKVSYTFSVQAVYAEKRSGKVSVQATPVSSLLAPSAVEVLSGSGRVKLTWKKPDAESVRGYKITVAPGEREFSIDDKTTESYVVTGLENDKEYTLLLQAVYAKGNSEAAVVKVTPGIVSPMTGLKTYVMAGEQLSLGYNDLYFMDAVKSVEWFFNGSDRMTGTAVTKTLNTSGEYTVKIVVTYTNLAVESAESTVYVIGEAWQSVSGYVKTSNAIFSRDGKTFYLPSSNFVGDLNAFDAATGSKKWAFGISSITYGGGAAVGADDIIYQSARNGVLYAIHPNGSKKWEYNTEATAKRLDCFPAVSADGATVYTLDGDNVLHAIRTSDGSLLWKKSLEGVGDKAGAVGIDRSGKIYVGTRLFIYAFAPDGNELWKTAAAVTEIGSFAIGAGVLYAAQVGSGGLIALDTNTGQQLWTVASDGDAYAPIIAKDGTVYFVDKGGKSLYAVTPAGKLKWTFVADAALTYCFPVLDSKGAVYFGSSKGTIYAIDGVTGEKLWSLQATATGENAKIMSGMTVGTDKKLYISYIGGLLKAIPIFAGPETSTWSCRGGNIHGTCQL